MDPADTERLTRAPEGGAGETGFRTSVIVTKVTR